MRQIQVKGALIVLVIFSLPFSGFVYGQTNTEIEGYQLPPAAENTLGLFDRSDILEISLRYDIGYYIQEKPDKEYMDALMTIYFSPEDSLNKNIMLRARGNYRYRTCIFPPIRLNFKDSNFGYDDLDMHENIKIVTHCDTSEIFEKYMLREFLIYKMMNIISDFSFRVRLLKVHYIDISNSSPVFTNYAFAIEPIKELIERKGGAELENVELDLEDMLDGQIENISLFQYMIGNSDWFFSLGHNIKFIDTNGSEDGGIAAIPYDFDFCGFVNAAYAQPRVDLGLELITDRAYLGPCPDDAKLRRLLASFQEYKEQFIDIIRNFEYLDRAERRELERYIESFFNEYKRDQIIENIKKTCTKN